MTQNQIDLIRLRLNHVVDVTGYFYDSMFTQVVIYQNVIQDSWKRGIKQERESYTIQNFQIFRS